MPSPGETERQETQRSANAAVSAADAVFTERDPERKLDVSDVKAPVKAINFTDNGGEAGSVLGELFKSLAQIMRALFCTRLTVKYEFLILCGAAERFKALKSGKIRSRARSVYKLLSFSLH